MFNISKRLYQLLVLAVLFFGLAACGGSSGTVAVLMPELETERWRREAAMLESYLAEKGYEVIRLDATNDAVLQSDQVDNMVKEGVRAIIIVPVDGDALVRAVERAIAENVKVIAYDRLVKTPKLSAYLSFDNREAGRLQAQAVIDMLDIESRPAFERQARLVRISGGPENHNNVLYQLGQADTLASYRQVRFVVDEVITARDQITAQRLMESILAEEQNIEAVLLSNELLTLGVLQAFRETGLGDDILVSGQESPASISNRIASGDVAFSIFRDRRDLPPLTVRTLDSLIKEQPLLDLQRCSMADLTGDPDQEGTIFCVLLPVQLLTGESLFDLVVRSGYQPYDAVYREIPESLRPVRL
jgi:D-xylose transport system substrate-binding protein